MNGGHAGDPGRLRLGVLDQSPISEGSSGPEALRNTLGLAALTDRLGYHRYWIAEHHGTPMLASPSPEALIGPVAMATRGIRVGSGGIMLPHYSPVKVAETFSMLAGLFPDRIDLGIGRAPGSDQRTAYALQRDRRQLAPDDFPDQLVELLGYLEGTIPPEHPFAGVARLPGRPYAPEVYLLGSSLQSALWAGQLDLPYVFADFINPEGAPIAERYRAELARHHPEARPRIAVAVWALAAETDEEAEQLSASHRMAMTLLRRGQLIPVPTVETALEFLAREGGLPFGGRRRIVGTPERVKDGIEAAAAEYGADEVMVVTITHSHAARLRSYELVAEAFGLDPRA
ncbi:LLM class flavin-dependent oxidoreductase [Propylenella binzhouense]|uniref:LLM class flavin-dependent oxidoreductase n=1 Tax=Propylenella binzhouense TaxID=2555902 RepID=A0A964T5V4_9HYPH|nr:LLM class flavin-dependent oxidoreductase [Propylenella binzhouense]MYZ47997.1 LLM class flavin-dependent oxidoreductase [Propylenella binzhouense]